MTVYVYAEAYKNEMEYMQIIETKVFTSLLDARNYLESQVNRYLEDFEEGYLWDVVYKDSDNANLIYDENKDESVMRIEEHEI